jgi:hypothetical protein
MTRADSRKFHYVYRIDRFDGKFYIGLHSTDIMEDGYFGSGTRLSNSLRYHGKDKHTKMVLKYFDTRQEAKDYEKFLITDEMRSDTLCMNIAPGGGGGFINEEHALKFHRAGWKAMTASISSFQLSERSKKLWEKPTDKMLAAASQKIKAMTIAATSIDANNKRKVTLAERNHQQGNKNSQFGSCWVTDGIKPVKVKKDSLDDFLAKGFRRGRK